MTGDDDAFKTTVDLQGQFDQELHDVEGSLYM